MKYVALLAIVTLLSGCSFLGLSGPDVNGVNGPITDKLAQDMATSSQIGTIVGRPEINQCSDYISSVVATLKTNNAMIDQLNALDTRGLVVASSLKDYFSLQILQQSGQTAYQDFQKNFPVQCGAVQQVIQQQIMQYMLQAASHGVVQPTGVPVQFK